MRRTCWTAAADATEVASRRVTIERVGRRPVERMMGGAIPRWLALSMIVVFCVHAGVASATEYRAAVIERLFGSNVEILAEEVDPTMASADADWASSALTSGSGSALAEHGQLSLQLELGAMGAGTGFAQRIEGRVEASMEIDDVVISGPASEVSLAFSADWMGFAMASSSGGSFLYDLERKLRARVAGTDAMGSPVTTVFVEQTIDDVGAIDETITTPMLTVSLAHPVTIELQLEATGEVQAWWSDSVVLDVDASHVAHPAVGLPVFDLPPGFTANSVDGRIVDNVYVPEPGAPLLLVAGLGFLSRLARRRSRASI